jgi:hypothetical protein
VQRAAVLITGILARFSHPRQASRQVLLAPPAHSYGSRYMSLSEPNFTSSSEEKQAQEGIDETSKSTNAFERKRICAEHLLGRRGYCFTQ